MPPDVGAQMSPVVDAPAAGRRKEFREVPPDKKRQTNLLTDTAPKTTRSICRRFSARCLPRHFGSAIYRRWCGMQLP